jgi:hypothetical protein
MDAQALSVILDKYQNREIDLIEASFQLTCIMGCNSTEAIALLEHYKPTEDAVE